MQTQLDNLILADEISRRAQDSGTRVHARLARVWIDGADFGGDVELCDKIRTMPDLIPFFKRSALTEVPIAGYINNHFISRRIDRMVVDDTSHQIYILDYKTDTDRNIRRDKYMTQIMEYVLLMRQAMPGYNVFGYILWTSDWCLEKVA